MPLRSTWLALLALILLASLLARGPVLHASERRHGHEVLELEAGLFGDTILHSTRGSVSRQEVQRRLDDLLDRAAGELATQREDPRAVLPGFAELLRAEGYTYRDTSDPGYALRGYHTLHMGLAKREVDCVLLAHLYLAFADELDLPLRAVFGPGHVHLRWTGREELDWEPTLGEERPATFYPGWLDYSRKEVERGVYGRPLARAEVLALVHYERASVLAARGELEPALVAAHLAAEAAPRIPDVHDLLGALEARRGREALAAAHFERALALDPGFRLALEHRERLGAR